MLEGIGVPVKWTRSEAEVRELSDADAKAAQAQDMLAQMDQGAGIMEKISKAGEKTNTQPQEMAA